jgi:hypothetical protein
MPLFEMTVAFDEGQRAAGLVDASPLSERLPAIVVLVRGVVPRSFAETSARHCPIASDGDVHQGGRPGASAEAPTENGYGHAFAVDAISGQRYIRERKRTALLADAAANPATLLLTMVRLRLVEPPDM